MKHKVLAMLLCLAMALTVALPGTLAVSANEDGDSQPAVDACTCGEEDDVHAEDCPLYVQPEQPGEEQDTPAAVLPDCTCPEGYQKQTDYDHDTECALNLGRLHELTNEQLALLWQTLTETERAYILQFAARNGFTDEQIEYIKQLEEAQKKQDYCNSITSAADVENGVTVFGVPAGVTVNVSAADADIEDAIVALDISLLDAQGNEWQPCEDEMFREYTEGFVAVELDVSRYSLADGTVVTLTHIHNGTPTAYTYVVIDGKITFYTDSFSIYVVSSTSATSGTAVSSGSTYNMTVGEEKIFYYNLSSNQWNATLIGAVWSVTDENNAVTYTVYDNGYNSNERTKYWTWKAQWIKIAAQRAGTVTVTATCYYSYTEGWGGPWGGGGGTTQYTTTTETFTINVSEATGFHIEDKIAETGCLVPTWSDETDGEGYTYTWTRSDGQTVKTDALNDNGSVNVSIDRGGVTNSRSAITYTVTASKDGADPLTASFKVIYGQEILNPSFENPSLSSLGNNVTQRAVYNGYEGLYWKTTAPGTIKTLGLDVELWTPAYGQSSSQGPAATPDGLQQYAELNAEAAGTLYQDILTTSGATLSWSFSHAGRTSATNKMYIVIAATKDAQSVGDNDDIRALIEAAGSGIPDASTSQAGKEFTYNSGTYVIWQHTATAKQWSTLSGTYTVPEGQYLTRLFFAAGPNDSGDNTLGNFIDGVDAGEKMSYKVEYYPDGSLASDKTETANGTVYTTVSLQNLQAYLDSGYVITSVKVNGKDYSGDIRNGLYITDYGTVENQDEAILVKITLRKKAITVTKVVTIEGWEELNDAQRLELVNGYTAAFELYDSNGTKHDSVTLTVANVANDGTVTITGEFANAGSLAYGQYTVTETGYGTLTGYVWDSTTYSGGTAVDGGVSVTISESSPTAAVTVTNHYKVGLADLTITKSGAEAIDENQTFIFNVVGADNFSLTVTIHGNGSVTIKDLPIGSYTVTEVTEWSWRYQPTDGAAKTITLTAGDNPLTFTNTRENVKWLDGDCWCENLWSADGITKKDDDEN